MAEQLQMPPEKGNGTMESASAPDLSVANVAPTAGPAEVQPTVTPQTAHTPSEAEKEVQQTPSLDSIVVKMEDQKSATPGSTTRGSTRGRPRGGRARGGGRGGKRKREDRDDGDSDSSVEMTTPFATMTKSGRSISKPTSYVPPPAASPTTTSHKRKRTYRRNPESAVCKVCLRGTSPASNMIVFCDGCNTPYHRYCHQPPIDQSVIDEVDKEWYCKPCQEERVIPVPESEIVDFAAAEGASVEQRQRYFASLPPGMLVTLLTKATTMRPDLPLFDPDFRARQAASTSAATQPAANGHSHPPVPVDQASATAAQPAQPVGHAVRADAAPVKEPEVPEDHPPNYPRPGNGLMRTLSREQMDARWLVDDDHQGAFTHIYQVDPSAANARMNATAGAER